MKESFDLIILTKSAKFGGFCVAGIEPVSRQWRRLITSDIESHGALKSQDLVDIKGKQINVLDYVRVTNAEYRPGSIQTENYLIDRVFPMQYVRSVSIQNVLTLNTDRNRSTVFLGDKYVMRGDVSSLEHSLELHCVRDLRIYTVKSGDKLKTKADFVFAGKRHEQFSVTDREYFLSEGDVLQIEKACIVFSIADDEWSRKNGHFKYIAAIYDLKWPVAPQPAKAEMSQNAFSEHWSEGNENIADLLCDDMPEFDHPSFGKSKILSMDREYVMMQVGTEIKKLSAEFLLQNKILPLESEELLKLQKQLTIERKYAPQEAIESVHRAVKGYLSVLERDNKGKSIVSGTIVSLDKNVLTIRSDRKIPYPDAIEFMLNGITYNHQMLSVEDYNADTLQLKVRALGKCANEPWRVGGRIDIVSDLKFLLRNLDKWYGRYKKHIAYPPMPTMRGGIRYMHRIPSEEQQRAIVRSLNAPVSYVWGAPGTGKTGYVLANCVRYCLQTGRKIGLFAPTNHALDMALLSVIDDLRAHNIPYDELVLRLGVATRQLQEQYPEVCEHKEQADQSKKYSALCDQIQKIIKWRKTLNNAAIIEKAYPQFQACIDKIELLRSVGLRIKECEYMIQSLESEVTQINEKIASNMEVIVTLEDKLCPGIGAFFLWVTGEKTKIESRIVELKEANHQLRKELSDREAALDKKRREKKEHSLEYDKHARDNSFDSIQSIAALSSYMKAFVSSITYENCPEKFRALKKEVADTKAIVLQKLKDYGQYEQLSDEQLIEQYRFYMQQASTVGKDKKSIALLAATLDVYNSRVGVPEPGETDHQQFCMSFDQIFLDEAGYCSLPKALPLFAQHCPVTLLGDHMQLSPISEMSAKNEAANPDLLLWKQSAITIGNLLTGTLVCGKTMPDAQTISSNLTLSHRFSHELASILDNYVYHNGFSGIGGKKFSIQCIDVGQALPDDVKNSSTPEADAVIALTKSLLDDYVVLTPYRNQESLIRKKNWKLAEEEKLMTIHRSQGREWNTVILSLVDDAPGFFTSSKSSEGIHVLNTAISRTKEKLILVGNINDWSSYSGQMISDLVRKGTNG